MPRYGLCLASLLLTSCSGHLRTHDSKYHNRDAPLVHVNATTAVSGDTVLVSWQNALKHLRPHVRLDSLAEMKTEWYEENGSHLWRISTSSSSSPSSSSASSPTLWLGQFSPAIESLDDVVMTGTPHGSSAPETTPPFTTPAPVKFISGTQLAKGEWAFVVTNMRASVNWVLFEGSLTSSSDFHPLALSPPVLFDDALRPMHARLARTSCTDEMRVSWTAANSSAAYSTVQWGLEPSGLNRTQVAAPSTYTAGDLCGAPANSSGFHDPGVFFSAVLDLSLEPAEQRLQGLRYYYQFGGDEVGWSPIRSFMAPKPANPHVPLSIVVTADMGETYEDGSQYHWEEPAAINTTLGIASLFNGPGGIDVAMHAGDLSYATGYESEWDRFMEQIEPISGYTPYMTGQGNHERDYPGSGNSIGGGDSGGECGVPTQGRFNMPTCAQPNTAPCINTKSKSKGGATENLPRTKASSGPVGSANDGWYSFEQGPVHFLHLNTEMSSLNGSRQFQFVANDLAAVNRSLTPWVFVFGHRQMYSGNSMTPQNELGDLEALMMLHKVDLALWGHIHFAQQSCPMYKAVCVNTMDAAGYDAPVHVVIGNAGQGLVSFPPEKDRAAWSLYQAKEWGFSHVAVHNATHLTFTFYGDNGGAAAPPPIHHTFDIVRKYPRV